MQFTFFVQKKETPRKWKITDMNSSDLILPQLLLQSHNHIAGPVKVHTEDVLESKEPKGWATSKKTCCDNVVAVFSINYVSLW